MLPTLSGVLYFLSWIGFGIWPLAFVCLLPLLWSLREATPLQALKLGAWMGFVTHLGGYTWIMHLLSVFAFAPLPLAFGGYLLVCAAQGLLFGVFSMVLRWAWIRAPRWPLVALVPVALVATEAVYPLLFQSYTGVALMPLVPLIQIADLGGVLLLTALQALVNGALADLFIRRSRSAAWPLAAAALALVASTTYGLVRLRSVHQQEQAAPHLRVGLAQPNVGEIELHQNPYLSVRTLWEQTAELHVRGAELVVWPEVGYNVKPVYPAADGRVIQGGVPVPLIAGVERVTGSQGGEEQIYNSAIAIDARGNIGDHFDKIELLAFGEYIPGGEWFPQIYQWSPLASHLSRGQTTKPLRAAGFRFATFICYEDILPKLVRKTMQNYYPEGRADAMVNLTNDSWYGSGFEQEEHLMLAAVRTIEHRRWLLRATSTGYSAFVDASGRVVQRIGRNQRGVAVHDVPMLQGTTLYELFGDWPGWVSLAALALIGVRAWMAARKQART